MSLVAYDWQNLLSFPSNCLQVWKQICGEPVTEADLAGKCLKRTVDHVLPPCVIALIARAVGVDLMLVESMQKLRNVESLGVDASSFNDIFMETFTVTTADGRQGNHCSMCVCILFTLS